MIEVPVSCGELLDKLTILEIKVQRLVDPAAIANVCREHDLLRERYGTLVDRPDLVPLIDELRRINRALWEIEDEICDHERRGEFGPSFSALARSVYRTNDRRAAVERARRCGGPEPRTSALLARAPPGRRQDRGARGRPGPGRRRCRGRRVGRLGLASP